MIISVDLYVQVSSVFTVVQGETRPGGIEVKFEIDVAHHDILSLVAGKPAGINLGEAVTGHRAVGEFERLRLEGHII